MNATALESEIENQQRNISFDTKEYTIEIIVQKYLESYKWANSRNDESSTAATNSRVKGHDTPKATGEEKVSQRKDQQQTVNCFGSSNHKALQPRIALMRAE